MIPILFVMLLLICLYQAKKIMVNPVRFLHFPGVVVFAYFVFVLPQILALWNTYNLGRESFGDYAIVRVLIVSILCLVMSIAGFNKRPGAIRLHSNTFMINSRAASMILLGYCAIGYYFYYSLGNMEAEIDSATGNWTGLVTIIYTLATMFLVGTTGLLLLTLTISKTLLNRVVVTLSLLLMAYIGVVVGRRSMVFLILMLIACSMYFAFKIKPSRWIILSFTVFTMLMLVSTGEYRSGLKEAENEKGFSKSFSILKKIDLVNNFKQYIDEAGTLEMRNAAYTMEAVARTREYGLGRKIWNGVVFRFVPAQILGRDFKDSLMFDLDHQENIHQMGYETPNGSTLSGIGDSFLEFGYLGCLVFYLLGRMMRLFWELAVHKQVFYFQVLYIFCIKETAILVTHGIITFVPSFLYFVIFMIPILWISKRRRQRSVLI